jgi:4-hydroxy-2-oxoglutarate aldolase
MLLEGMYLPLTTPFYPDGRVNLPKLEQNVARYSKSPAAGFVVLGGSGEATLLTEDEMHETMRAAAHAAAAEKVLLAGISRDSVRATVALAEAAAELQYDAVVVRPPSILSAADLRELLVYFQTVADRSPLPVVLENAADSLVPLDVLGELAAHSNVLGLIDHDGEPIAALLARAASIRREVTVTPVFAAVTGRMASVVPAVLASAETLGGGGAAIATAPVAKTFRTRGKTVGFQILAANTASMLDALRAGAQGTASAFAACAPQACHEVYTAWKDGDAPLAEEKQARIVAAAQEVEASIGSLKFACDLNGYFGGWPRLPLLPPTGEARTRLEHLMKGLRS